MLIDLLKRKGAEQSKQTRPSKSLQVFTFVLERESDPLLTNLLKESQGNFFLTHAKWMHILNEHFVLELESIL